MIKSMTGFGRCEKSNEDVKVLVEMKSVNHRYCEINVRLPKKFLHFEPKIKNLIKQEVIRGKVDVYINFSDYRSNNVSVKYNDDLAQEYMDAFERMKERFHIENDVGVSSLTSFPEIITLEEKTSEDDEMWDTIEEVVVTATKELIETKSREGENLQKDILFKLEEISNYLSFIEDKAPQIVEDYYNRLRKKVADLLGDTQIEESVIATEVATLADKVCVDEEIVRLKSHISNMKDTIDEKDGIGRKLDFISQEMNREANTILSKVNDLEVTNVAINLKAEVEKVREQIQNIE